VIRLRCGDAVRAVELRATAQGPQVMVDGTAHAGDVQPVSPGVFVLRDGIRREIFHCVRDGSRIHLFWRGVAYVLHDISESERTSQRHAAHRLEAPMPGRVIAVNVEPGQAVKGGEEILVVEAMKMENAIRAPRDGVVKSITVKVGDMVSPGVVLVELEE
jgi:3-methylcrotonyl-CoA carboxylase alpha subunit